MYENKVIVTACTLLAMATASAQNAYDAEKLLGNDLNGTARFVGMGGAMGALGGDISVMSSNPAGIGIFVVMMCPFLLVLIILRQRVTLVACQ